MVSKGQELFFFYFFFYELHFLLYELHFFILIFDLGSDLSDDTIATESVPCMSEHNQLLCYWLKPHLGTKLCSYNLSLSTLWADAS